MTDRLILTDARGVVYEAVFADCWDPADDDPDRCRETVYYEDEERPVGAVPLYRLTPTALP
jgi:hypothetical protein